jgi:hypothetical protein
MMNHNISVTWVILFILCFFRNQGKNQINYKIFTESFPASLNLIKCHSLTIIHLQTTGDTKKR